MPFSKMLLLAAVGMVFGISGIYIWTNWYPQYKAERAIRENYNRLAAKEKEYQDQVYKALAEDTYGGKTPEETMKLFAEALRKGDVELASKYFVLDTKMESFGTPDFLSREKWRDYIIEVKSRDLLIKMADDIEKSTPIQNPEEGDFGYEILNKDGSVGVLIDMQLNSFSKVWKIESL